MSLLIPPCVFVRLQPDRYTQARLLEINSHSLFSRWFSESGKLVQRLFNSIMEMVEDEDCFVAVLIGSLLQWSIHSMYAEIHVLTR